MRTLIYLKKNNRLLAEVNLEVVPRGIYNIYGKDYELKDPPKFYIAHKSAMGDILTVLQKVELFVEAVEDPSKDDTL